MTDDIIERLAIRDLVENWALWRDAGDWDRFLTCWHAGARMNATWYQGPAADFIRASREGWAKGVSILHFLGGTSIDREGDRAIAQTKMTISQRGLVDGVLCDVVCTGRFYDFIEKRDGRWGVVLRQPIYERDRLDPVAPDAKLSLDPDLLSQFPERLPASRLHPDEDRLHREARHAGPAWLRGRGALSPRQDLARGWPGGVGGARHPQTCVALKPHPYPPLAAARRGGLPRPAPVSTVVPGTPVRQGRDAVVPSPSSIREKGRVRVGPILDSRPSLRR